MRGEEKKRAKKIYSDLEILQNVKKKNYGRACYATRQFDKEAKKKSNIKRSQKLKTNTFYITFTTSLIFLFPFAVILWQVTMEGKKISFGFKKTKKLEKLPVQEKVDFIECVEEKSIKIVG